MGRAPKPPVRRRALIGFGEKYRSDITIRHGFDVDARTFAYTPGEAASRLTTGFRATANDISTLPAAACPGDMAVAMITLHPESVAKSYFPGQLLRSLELDTIGSRVRRISPGAWSSTASKRRREAATAAQGTDTIELYVAGPRKALLKWSSGIDPSALSDVAQTDLRIIEGIRPLRAVENRLQLPRDGTLLKLEVALHECDGVNVLDAFSRYLTSIGGRTDRDLRVGGGGLDFLPVWIPRERTKALEQFVFLRSTKPESQLRGLPTEEALRSVADDSVPYTVPSTPPSSRQPRAAILDGGLPPTHGLPGVTSHPVTGVNPPGPSLHRHGLAVTGAFLWGPLDEPASAPYAGVDHYQVIDDRDAISGDFQLLKVLKRITTIITAHDHELINLSLGPCDVVSDFDVHPWTSTLDALTADGKRLITAAVGNDGTSGVNRVQVPSDGVNLIGVGASNRRHANWRRADYSCVGPGRRPGFMKPDLVAFGGSEDDLFQVLRLHGSQFKRQGSRGTSYASPLTLRAIAGVRSLYGAQIKTLTLRALVVHGANPGPHAPADVGHGLIANVSEMATCGPATARVIYQGTLTAKKTDRLALPVPEGLTGKIRITATLCYACTTRSSDPWNYTTAGLDVTFRPDATKMEGEQNLPKTKSFFSRPDAYASEHELRTVHHRWETTRHNTVSMLASSLHGPMFDVHYVPRHGAHDTRSAPKIPYALVVTVEARRHADIYDKVLARFPHLKSLVQVPTQVHT